MGASEGLQSLWGHGLDLTLPLFSLQLRVLGDRFEFEYRSDHLSSCRLSLCFSLDEFSMFSPYGFCSHFLARHTPPLCCHSLDILGYVHWSSFYTVYLSWAQYLIICLILGSIFNSMLIFSLQKGERHIFIFTHFSKDSPWSPYHFFIMELELEVESRIFWSRLGIDLVLVLFFTPHSFSSHIDHFLDHR